MFHLYFCKFCTKDPNFVPYIMACSGRNTFALKTKLGNIGLTSIQLIFQLLLICSGGTIAGLSLGSWLSSLKAKVGTLSLHLCYSFYLKHVQPEVPSILQVHAFSVCDDPEYFYNFVQVLLDGLQAGVKSRDIVSIQNVSIIFICE